MAADIESSRLEASTSLHNGYGRIVAGLLQGVALYWLYRADQQNAWLVMQPYLFVPLLLAVMLLPVLLISAMGHMAGRRLGQWIGFAALVVIVLGIHDVWRNEGVHRLTGSQHAGRYPSELLLGFVWVFFFIAHALVMAGAQEHRRLASYATYFETAWKLFIRASFSLLFVAALWLMLHMGATLFMLVRLDFLKKLLTEVYFCAPVLCSAFACAMHITDVRPAIVRGIRTLLLVLMSWLLPLTAFLLLAFLCTLPFTGLASLWKTGHATTVLLGADAMLIVLINAAYQNGEVAGTVAGAVRLSARVAAMLLLPLTALGLYALGLRVADYGWSADRLIAAACLLVASCYALGYVYAAWQQDVWLRTLSMTNVRAAWLVLAVMLALFTPLADPARISVHSQMARLEQGAVSAAKFDYGYLKFEGLRYGRAALIALKDAGGQDALVKRQKATEALAKTHRGQLPALGADAVPGEDIAANLTVWPKGARLPEGFPLTGWETAEDGLSSLPLCLVRSGKPCEAFVLDLTGDGKAEVLLVGAEKETGTAVLGQVEGKWEVLGRLPYGSSGCDALLGKLKAGAFQVVTKPVQDLQVDGQRLVIERSRSGPKPACR